MLSELRNMGFRRSLILAGCVFFFFPALARAQTTSGVRGVVLAKDGSPLQGAAVTITNTTSTYSRECSYGSAIDARNNLLTPPGRGRTFQASGGSRCALTDPDRTDS